MDGQDSEVLNNGKRSTVAATAIKQVLTRLPDHQLPPKDVMPATVEEALMGNLSEFISFSSAVIKVGGVKRAKFLLSVLEELFGVDNANCKK